VIENKETFSWHTLALDSSSNSHAVFFLHQQDSLQFLSPDAKPMWQCDAPRLPPLPDILGDGGRQTQAKTQPANSATRRLKVCMISVN
jgi:hypothetical protein